MPTSGSTNFEIAHSDVLRDAALKIKAIPAAATMNPTMRADFARNLNNLVATWRKAGMHLWKIREVTLFPAVGQRRYDLSTDSEDHCTESFVQTALSADEAAGQTALSVEDDDDISDNDHIGIVLDDGTIQWTTVNGTPVGNVVTVDDALTGAASDGNAVFAYTTKIPRPLQIEDADGAVRRFDYENDRETPIGPPISRDEYNCIPNKGGEGPINQVFYDQQRSAGYLNVWQVPTSITELLKLTVYLPIEDFDAAGDLPDLPNEWNLALVFNLAVVMAPEFNVPRQQLETIAELAQTYLATAVIDDREPEAVFFQPDRGR